MAEDKGVWRGWYWRYIGITAVVIIALQLAAYYIFHYDVLLSMPIGVLFASYMVAPHVKVRRLANTMAAVLVTFAASFVCEIILDHPFASHGGQAVAAFIETNLFALAMGVVMAYAYLKLTLWSERKRAALDAKRRGQESGKQASQPPVRIHHKRPKKKH